jgi:hypothetical protein
MLYTGLTEIIGNPREYEKNQEEPQYFERDHDLSIPLGETNEHRNKPTYSQPHQNEYNDQKTTPDAVSITEDNNNN